MSNLLLGLDIGTTATKCVLVDPGRGVIAAGARPVTLSTRQAGWAEEDPATWWRNACELITAVLTAVGAGGGDVPGGADHVAGALAAHGDVVVELGGAGTSWSGPRSRSWTTGCSSTTTWSPGPGCRTGAWPPPGAWCAGSSRRPAVAPASPRLTPRRRWPGPERAGSS